MELLAEQPAATISLREVARRAGVSHNAPYHHFGDRTQLLKVLAERSMADLVAGQRAIVEEGLEPGEQAVELGLHYLRFALDRPHAFAAIYDPTICVPGSPTETMAPLIEEEEQILYRTADAMTPDASEELLQTRVAALWGIAHGLAELGRAGHLPPEACEAAIRDAVANLAAD